MANNTEWRNSLAKRMMKQYCVVDPYGVQYEVVGLKQFAKEHNLPLVSLWYSEKANRPITKGRAKGWFCVKI